MANTRLEMDMELFLSVRIATAAAHVIKAKELFDEAKDVLVSAGEDYVDQALLTGLTEALAEDLYAVVDNACTNTGAAKTEMCKIDQGVAV